MFGQNETFPPGRLADRFAFDEAKLKKPERSSPKQTL
jgi:hypothetical protein